MKQSQQYNNKTIPSLRYWYNFCTFRYWKDILGMASKKLKIILFLLMLTGIVPRAFSAYTVIGCVSDDTGYLYTGPAGVNAPAGYSYTEWYYQNGWRSRTVNVAGSPNAGSPAYETTPVVNEGLLGTGIYCQSTYLGPCVIRTRSQCRQCTGPYDYNRNQNNTDMWYEQAGKLYGYNTCQVPIDDYAGLLLVLVAGLGFFVVRKSM